MKKNLEISVVRKRVKWYEGLGDSIDSEEFIG